MVATAQHGTTPRRRRLIGAAILALLLCLLTGALVEAEAAKKKKKAPSTFKQTKTPNAAIPEDAAAGPSTPVVSTITVPKKFKGKVVGDVNVTGIQTTGSGAGAANHLDFALRGPNGITVVLSSNGIGDDSIGPLTLDDDTPTSICDSATLTCSNPNATLLRPFAGTSNLLFQGTAGTGPLSAFDGTPLKGNWTFSIWDVVTGGAATSTLNTWGLAIKVAKPVR